MRVHLSRIRGALAAAGLLAALGITGAGTAAGAARAGAGRPVTAYVLSSASPVEPLAGAVTPIRTATNTALKPITVGIGPAAIAITADGRYAYVADCCTNMFDGNQVTPIRTATNTASKAIKVKGSPVAIAIMR
jgi:DNA-binding beta-propeller fold protein YncE